MERMFDYSSFSFLLFFLFFPDASTMEAMTTSPNKKSGNKLHWIRMLGWMDAWKVAWAGVDESCFELVIDRGQDFSIKS